MYTSPFGNGHYVLQSENPTGPFVRVTENLGNSIDGSVLKDDGGLLYFYHSGDDGIHAHGMSSPTSLGSEVVLGETRMNGWTEGPCVIKRNGKYYMIYTGNHVISKGYRINLAVSSSPMSGYVPQEKQNPVILSSEGSQVGLGHGSIVSGPDLDSHYILYHNLAGDFGVGPYRHLNFDRMGWNGSKMIVMGPTNTNQVTPDLPDFSDYFEGSVLNPDWTLTSNATWTVNGTALNLIPSDLNSDQEHLALAPGETGDYFTAEFNAQEVNATTGSFYGIVFNYTDNLNYGTAVFNSIANTLVFKTQTAGIWNTPSTYTLKGVVDFKKSHCIRLERTGSKHLFYVDGMLKKTWVLDQPSGKVGYYSFKSSASFGPVAYSRKVNGSGIFNDYKPVPGTIDAALYKNGGEGIAYHDLSPSNTGGATWRKDSVETILAPTGDYTVLGEKGEWLKYAVMVKSATTYSMGLKYASASTSKIRISEAGSLEYIEIELPATGGVNSWRTKILEGITLKQGIQDILIEVLEGSLNLYTMRFVESPLQALPLEENFTQTSFGTNWNYNDGSWNFSNEQIASNGYGKCLMGSAYTNYIASVDLNYQTGMNGGLLVRAKNPALGGAGNDVQAGADFVQAYFVTLGTNGCVLGKHNYNWATLATSTGTYTTGVWYNLAVKVEDDNIKVYLNNSPNPIIDYTDPEPFISGKTGFRSFNSTVKFDNLEIRQTGTTTDLKKSEQTILRLSSNPVKENLILNFTSPTKKGGILELFSSCGSLVYKSFVPENLQQFNVSVKSLNSGIFLIRYSGSIQSFKSKIQIE